MKCRACGKEFDEGRYCPYCGTPVDSEPVRTERTVEKKKSNRIVGYNWVVVLVIAAMLIVFFLKTPKYGQKLYGTWQVTELVAEGMDSNSDEDGLYWYAYNSLFKEGTKVEFNKDGTMIIGGRVCKYKVVDNQNIDITVDSEVRAQWGFWEKDRNKLLLDFDIPGGKLIQVQMYRPENIPVETGGSSTNENSAEDGIENEEKSATTNADENGENKSMDDENAQETENKEQGKDVDGSGTEPKKEIRLEETSDTCLDGNAELYMVGCNSKESTITVRLYNNADIEIRTFGLPTQVIGGRSEKLDWYSNMDSDTVEVAPDTYADIVYHIDPAIFEEGGRIEGELFIMGPSLSDRYYSLDVVVAEE